MSAHKESLARRDGVRQESSLIDSFDWAILEFLEMVGCPICPPSIAINIRRSPTDTMVRCRMLHSLGLLAVRDTTRKAYSLNSTGEDFIAGNVSVEALDPGHRQF